MKQWFNNFLQNYLHFLGFYMKELAKFLHVFFDKSTKKLVSYQKNPKSFCTFVEKFGRLLQLAKIFEKVFPFLSKISKQFSHRVKKFISCFVQLKIKFCFLQNFWETACEEFFRILDQMKSTFTVNRSRSFPC